MTPPLIGITAARREVPNSTYPVIGAPESYVQAVINNGGTPLIIPTGLSEDHLAAIFAKVDGLVFPGGGDIEPSIFTKETHEKVYGISPERDALELKLMRWAGEREKPFLGICRGVQVMNVAFGGTLILDIPSQQEGALKHRNDEWKFLAHEIKVNEETRLASILGIPFVRVNSLHHQSVKDVAPPLIATAVAPDGVIEALELPAHPFGVGVQWHPEALQEQEPMRNLFRALVKAAQG